MAAIIKIGIIMRGIKNIKTKIPMTINKIFNNPSPHLKKQHHAAKKIINSKSRISNHITSYISLFLAGMYYKL